MKAYNPVPCAGCQSRIQQARRPVARQGHSLAEDVSRHGLAVARGRLEYQLSALIVPVKANAANERLSQHLWAHRNDLFTFLRQPELAANN
jgi:hypothetical protein